MSSSLDLLVRGAEVVTPRGLERADLGVTEGKIAALAAELDAAAAEVIEARDVVVFPGILDAHVHFNDPGRENWEGLSSGSAALAAGGGAAFFDMPLNSLPPVLDRNSFEVKKARAEEVSCLDFGLWGGLTPGNLDHLDELAAAGAVGLKAFLCGSGVPEFEAVTDTATLRRGMTRAAELGLLVAVHAEDEATTARLTAESRARVAQDTRSWLATRPLEAELAAIRRALEVAGETGSALHVVHVSSLEGLELITEAKRQGVNVSAETCPHYLLLTEQDVLQQGAVAKCAPPLREETGRESLWRALGAGLVDTVGSDHSPAPPEMKTSADFFHIWGGISGCQHGFPLLLSEAVGRWGVELALPRMARLLAANVASRFGLISKGRLEVGFDADFCLLRLDDPHRLDNSELLYRHPQGPYHGRSSTVRVLRTVARGVTVYTAGASNPCPHRGHLLRPKR